MHECTGCLDMFPFGTALDHVKLLSGLLSEHWSLASDLPDLDFSSPGNNKHVVLVMDGMTEFTTDTLQWALDNVVTAGCIVTLLGVMPWLNIPREFFLKTRNAFWTEELEDAASGERRRMGAEMMSSVVPQKKIVMGYPLRLLVVEQVATLCPTWVVFDGSHKRNKDFYAQKIPCNIFMMNDDGRVDMIKNRQMIHNGESISRELALSTSQMTVSDESKDTNK
ncbi:proline-rich receptor protein kinase PERK3 [Spatholobus suberectus]|nr:proline-rich receptor protein kinase PERK3 [Spatholobus suberectus]